MRDISINETTVAWIGVIGALLGAIVGVILSTGFDSWKQWRRRVRLDRALDDELRSNLHVLPAKKDMMERCKNAIKGNNSFKTYSVPFLRAIYDGHLSELSASLNIKQRNLLHVIYVTCRVIDDELSKIAEQVDMASAASRESGVARYLAALHDFNPQFVRVEKLINSYLKREPLDVFNMEMDLNDLKTRKFK